MSPFSEDHAITEAAERCGMEVIRTQAITITDKKALEAAGLMRKTPDYPRIRALLKDGAEVPGAALGPMEYVLRVPGVKEGELEVPRSTPGESLK
jgi:hypothetical protein